MRRKKKTTIVTFESHERITIRQIARRTMGWCEQCGGDVLMVTPNQAAVQLESDVPTIFRRMESGEIHFIEDSRGALLVCSASLGTPDAK